MRFRRRKNSFYFIVIMFFVLTIGLGYAYLNTTLSISGHTKISKNTWNVHFNNLVMKDGSVVGDPAAAISGDTTNITFGAALEKPGDYYQFNVDVVNEGSINAMLSDIVKTGITTEQSSYVDFIVTYDDGKELTKKDALPIGATETLIVIVKYKSDVSVLPTDDQFIDVSLKLTYVQDDGTSKARPVKLYKQLFEKDTLGTKGSLVTTDPEQTFIAGEEPNNYIWYSGKLWRAVSLDTTDNSVKLVTQWNQTAIPYSSGSENFSGSHAEMWLNDTGEDGFLGTLYNTNDFIKTDSVWNATMSTVQTKPSKTTMVSDVVGLLNVYEYTMSYTGTTYANGYLNNTLSSATITPFSSSSIWKLDPLDIHKYGDVSDNFGIRPSINLKSVVSIASGVGTSNDPYILCGDEGNVKEGTLLNTRNSGEYIINGKGNLYRIVNVEDKKTKIVSSVTIEDNREFDSNVSYDTDYDDLIYDTEFNSNKSTNIGYFLNNDSLNPSNGYLSASEVNMFEINQKWYLGSVSVGENYCTTKCTKAGINCIKNQASTTATVGMLRVGELLSGQFDVSENNFDYWTITPSFDSYYEIKIVNNLGELSGVNPTDMYGFRPSMYLKASVKITGGSGTKNDPFTISN